MSKEKTEWQKYVELSEKVASSCCVWVIYDPQTQRKAGEVIMRFTPNPYGRFGRGGMVIYVRDDTNHPNVITHTLCTTTTAGGCGYNKVRHMMEVMLRNLTPEIEQWWPKGVLDGIDCFNYYEDAFEKLGFILLNGME